MKKRVMVMMTIALSLTALTAVWADEAEEMTGSETSGDYMPDIEPPKIISSGDYSYYVNDDGGTVTIAEYTGDEEVIEIPSEIDGYQVMDIGGKAFIYTRMKSLSIPDSVRSIGNRAFDNCQITDRLELPEGCHIWVDAFCYAELPSEIEIPSGTVVEDSAFSYCDTIKKVRVGSGAGLKSRAFSYCDYLEEAVLASGCRLEKKAFEYCRELKKVTLCGPVEMDEEAFSYCGDFELIEAEEQEYDTSGEPDLSIFLTGGKSGSLAGGWEVTRDCAVPEEAQEVFDQAMPDHDRMRYDAAALLAKQVVAGTNYCFLRRTTVKDSEEQPTYQIVYIWQDPEGNAHVLNVKDIEFGLDDRSESGQDGHSITLTGEEEVFTDCPDSAKAGETVTVHTVDVCDGEVRIEVNGSDIGTWEEWGTYTFTMPDEDVELNGWIRTEGYPGA